MTWPMLDREFEILFSVRMEDDESQNELISETKRKAGNSGSQNGKS